MRFFALLLLLPLSLFAKVVEAFSVREVMPFTGNEHWVFIDLDNTLFQAQQALGHADWFYHLTQQRIEQGMSRDEAYRCLSSLD